MPPRFDNRSVVYGEGGARVGEYTNLGDGRWQDGNIYGGSQALIEERRMADAVYLAVPISRASVHGTRLVSTLRVSNTAGG